MRAAVRHPGAPRHVAAEKRLSVSTLYRLDDLDEMLATFFVITGFSFKTAFPFRIKIHDGALEECAFVATKLPLEKWLADGLHVAVNTEVAAVDRDLGKGAARARRPGGIPKLVPHELAHQTGVLFIVVECEISQAVDVSLFI